MSDNLSDSTRASFDEAKSHPCCAWDRVESMRKQRDDAIRAHDTLRQAYETHTAFNTSQIGEIERLRTALADAKAECERLASERDTARELLSTMTKQRDNALNERNQLVHQVEFAVRSRDEERAALHDLRVVVNDLRIKCTRALDP